MKAMEKSTFSAEYSILRSELVSLRHDADLSQRELATRLKVPHSWVAKVETGERRIDVVELHWFAVACGKDAAVVLADIAKKIAALPNRRASKGRRIS